MDDDLGQTGNALQRGASIEVGKHRSGTFVAPERGLLRVADQGENAVVAKQPWQQTAGNISTTDDQ